MIEHVFERLNETLDDLPSGDFDAPAQLGGEIVALYRVAVRGEAACVRRIVAFEGAGGWMETHASLASWIEEKFSCSRGEARRLINIGRLLEHVPHLAACYDGGEVSTAHMAAVV